MATISDRFVKKNREFLHRIVDISQNSDAVHQIPSEMTDSKSNSGSKSKSKGDKRIQVFTSCRYTCAMHEMYNIQTAVHKTAENDNDEYSDNRLESEEIMVPSGKYLIDGQCVKVAS